MYEHIIADLMRMKAVWNFFFVPALRRGWIAQIGIATVRPTLSCGVVAFLGFGQRDVADGLQEPAVVEPVDPNQRRELDSLEAPPRPARWTVSGEMSPAEFTTFPQTVLSLLVQTSADAPLL